MPKKCKHHPHNISQRRKAAFWNQAITSGLSLQASASTVYPAYGLGNMIMCHHTKDTTNCVSSSLISKLKERGEKLNPYIILKNTVFKKDKPLLNSTYWNSWIKESNCISPLHHTFHTQRHQHSRLGDSFITPLPVSEELKLPGMAYWRQTEIFNVTIPDISTGLTKKSTPSFMKIQKILKACHSRPNILNYLHHSSPSPKPLATALSRYRS